VHARIKYRYARAPSLSVYVYSIYIIWFRMPISYTYDVCARIKSNTTACRILATVYLRLLKFIAVVSNELFMKNVPTYIAAVNTAI